MRWGKRRYHRESYFARQHAKYTRRLKKQLIPGYGQHRKYDIKQWQNRVHERYYRQHTYPSQSERFRRWTEGYSYRSHPRIAQPAQPRTRRTYRRRSGTTVNRQPQMPHVSRAEKIKENEKWDSSPLAGCTGCGCFTFLLAMFLGGIFENGWVVLIVLGIGALFAPRIIQGAHLNNKKFAKQHAEQKQKQASAKSVQSSKASSASSSSAPASSARASSVKSIKASYVSAGSLANSTTDSLEAEMDSVVSDSEQGKGFDEDRMHQAVSNARSSFDSIYVNDPPMIAYAKSNLNDMDENITQAGREFNEQPSSSDVNLTIHFSVHGLSGSSSVSHSASTSSSSSLKS